MLVVAFAVILLGMMALGIAGLVWVVRGTVRQTQAGINLNRIVCPRCGAPQPAIRKPKNMRQAMWGGNTCPQCGLEMDKWGRAIA